MYQLLPASPVRPHILTFPEEAPLTYTFKEPIPFPYMWVQNLRQRGPEELVSVELNSSLIKSALFYNSLFAFHT